jgi:ABC-type Fe3+ transport system substrate-binding protein
MRLVNFSAPQVRRSAARWLRIAVMAVAASVVFARFARAESVDDIYARAKAEGGLSLYGAGPTALWEGAVVEFNKKYPEIKVAITPGFSNVLDKKVEQQLKDNKVEVDGAAFQTIQDFVRWAKEGVLLKYKPPGFDKVDAHWKDKDGAYVAFAVNAHPYAYNSQRVKPGDIPRSALDFLKPEFRGKLVAAYPQDDDATLYVFYGIVTKYGWSYMDKYMANQPNFIQGHLGVARSISAGDNLVTLDTIANVSLSEKAAGKPHDIAFSTVDPLPVWPLCGAIFKGGPHPNAARLFVAFYLSREQQARTGTWSSRSDVPPPAGLKPILSYKIMNSYRDFLTDEPRLIQLRKRFGDLVGPIRNAGGVR